MQIRVLLCACVLLAGCATRQRNEPWPHLLAAVDLTDPRYPTDICRVDLMKRLDVSLECRLTEFEDKNPNADPDLHSVKLL